MIETKQNQKLEHLSPDRIGSHRKCFNPNALLGLNQMIKRSLGVKCSLLSKALFAFADR